LKRNVKVAIRFNFESNDAARESKPLILNPGALWTLSQRYVRAGPAVDVARRDGFNRVCIRRPVTDQSSLSSDASRDCRDKRGETNVTGSESAAAMQRNAIPAIVSVAPVIVSGYIILSLLCGEQEGQNPIARSAEK